MKSFTVFIGAILTTSMQLIGIVGFVAYMILCTVSFVSSFKKAKKYRKQVESVTSLDRGTWSERDLIPKLVWGCDIDQRAIYHDLYIRKENGTYTQVDLTVPLPQGIIVFEVKDYNGWIFGNGNSKFWMQMLAFGKEKHQFYNPIWQNGTHITALRKLLPNNPDIPIFNVVVFYGNSKFKELEYDTTGNVRVIHNTQVIEFVNHIKSLPPAEYGNKYEVASVLAEGVRNGRDPGIRQLQIELAAQTKANSHELHSYNKSRHHIRLLM